MIYCTVHFAHVVSRAINACLIQSLNWNVEFHIMRTSNYISMEYTTLTSYCLSRDPAINTRSVIVSIRTRMLASLLRLKDALVDGCLVLDSPAH